MAPVACPHRFLRAYDDGDNYWDYLCLLCDEWIEQEDADPLFVSEHNLEDDMPWQEAYEENLRENWRVY